ncbi:CHAT domain-containing protein [Sphingomonas sp. NFX23]|uniref:CHAT domain-containing protein n=1 Tax=Sphingomonas sp. NFX23 TaxID=2819532 RepID=UPI003CF5AD75
MAHNRDGPAFGPGSGRRSRTSVKWRVQGHRSMSDWLGHGGYDWTTLEELERKLGDRLELLFPESAFGLTLSFRGDAIVLSGSVASEAEKSEALRQLASFTKVPGIVDEVEVAATFHPASDDDWFFSRQPDLGADASFTNGRHDDHVSPRVSDGSSGDRYRNDEPLDPTATAITRYPEVATKDELIAGARITITADLLVDPSTAHSTAVEIATLPPGWLKLDVDVALIAPSLLKVEPAKAKISIYEDGSSTPAVFAATLREDLIDGGAIEVFSVFSREARILETWQTSLGDAVPRAVELDPPPRLGISIAPDAPSPTFSVIIKGTGDGNQNWFWLGATEDAADPHSMTGDTQVGDAKAFAAGLLANCPTMGPRVFRRRMEKIGEDLWQHAPVEFRSAYLAMRNRWGAYFPIQLFVDEHSIPWEMMLPETAPGEDPSDHMLFTHPIARWPMQARGGRHVTLPSGSIRSFVPEYEGNATLPAARKEGAWLSSHHGARQSPPTVSAFLDLLSGQDSETIELIHFAGHGRNRSDDPDDGIQMQDGWVSIGDLSARATGLGPRDHPVVVLNACEAAATSEDLGWVEGWGPLLANRGFGAVVAPLWRVQDEAAHDVVVEAIDLLLTGRLTIGAAFTRGRAKVSNSSVASFAFTTYGDVMARVRPS